MVLLSEVFDLVKSHDADAISPVHGLPQDGRVTDPDYELFTTREMVEQAHALGMKIIPWTIDDEDGEDRGISLMSISPAALYV